MSSPQKSTGQPDAKGAEAARSVARAPLLQRQCSSCGGGGGECESCRKKPKQPTLQRSAAGSSQPAVAPPSVNRVLDSPGRPLDNSTRSFMEPRFGNDFSGVRVHTDPLAAESARAVDAHAYTVGQHIVFDSGRYDPHSTSGQQLLAHELVHTQQQHGLQRSADALPLNATGEYQHLEREAETVSRAVMNQPAPSASPRLTGRPLRPMLSQKNRPPRRASPR